MDNYRLYSLVKNDIPDGVQVMLDAFRNDPLFNAAVAGIPGGNDRLPAFYEAPLRYCLHYGTVAAPSPRLEGVAAWTDSENSSENLWRTLVSGSLWPGLRMGRLMMKKMWPLFIKLEKERVSIMESRPHIFLHMIGVRTDFRGKGLGGLLLNALIEEAKQRNRWLYLETETEENVNLYRHFGFNVEKTFIVENLSLPMWLMSRPPGN